VDYAGSITSKQPPTHYTLHTRLELIMDDMFVGWECEDCGGPCEEGMIYCEDCSWLMDMRDDDDDLSIDIFPIFSE